MISSSVRVNNLGGNFKSIPSKIMQSLSLNSKFNSSTYCNNYYEKVKNQHFFDIQYKSSALKFQNKGISMVGYHYHPQLVNLGNTNTKIVTKSNIINVHFVPEIDAQLNQDAWSKRKSIYIDMETAFKMFKVSPSAPQLSFENSYQDNARTHRTRIDLEYKATDNIVALSAEFETSGSQTSQGWDINFVLTFGEYQAFMQWIRTGLFYTSGTALMLNHSQQIQLKKAAILEQQQATQSAPTSSYTKKKK